MVEAELQGLVDRLAAKFRRSVAIDDPHIRLIAASPHYGDDDALRLQSILDRLVDPDIVAWVLGHGIGSWTEAGRLPARPDIAMRARLCQPVRAHGLLLGFVWVIEGDDRLTEDERSDLATCADQAGQRLYQQFTLGQRARFLHEDVLRRVLSTDADMRIEACEEVAEEEILTRSGRAVVLAVQLDVDEPPNSGLETDLGIAVVELTDRLGPGSSLVLSNRFKATLLHVLGRGQSTEAVVTLVREELRERLKRLGHPDVACRVAAGAPVTELAEAYRSHRQARAALRASGLLPSLGDTATWESLGPYAVLLEMGKSNVSEVLPPPVKMLLERDRHGALVQTAEVFLDLAGNATRTAEALHVHRATLHQRLRAIEEATGLDFHDGVDRLTMHLGLKMMRLHRLGPNVT